MNGGTHDRWIPLRGPKRLVIGADAFMVSAAQALREYVFRGHESSLALGQSPGRQADRDWIVAADNLPEVWQALAGTGATPGPEAGELELTGSLAASLRQVTGWRRAAMIAWVAIFPFIPALVEFIAHHLR